MVDDSPEMPPDPPCLEVVFASEPANEYLVAELWLDETMVAQVEWRDDVLVASWLTPSHVASFELARALSTAHERLVDNRLALDRWNAQHP